jgi:hypothetical protein
MFYPSLRLLCLSKYSLKRSLQILAVLCMIVTIGLNLFERQRWLTANTAYVDARQYFISGMVLMDCRTMGNFLIYPERMIWKPAVWLQQLITTTGLRLIPKNDGERAIWKYHFVLAPYINRIHAPHSKDVHTLIRTCEDVLETLATKTLADQDLNSKNKYIIYPLVTLYYQWSYHYRYSLNISPEVLYQGLYKDPKQYHYLQQVVEWSVKMEEEWQQHPAVTKYMRKHPDIELVQIVSVTLTLHEIILYQIHNLKFTCNDRYLNLYYDYVIRYCAKDSPYYRVDKNMKMSFDPPVLFHGTTINFFGHRLCNKPRLPAYTICTVRDLGGEGPGWYDAFIELNKRLVPKERQQEVLDRFEPWKWDEQDQKELNQYKGDK